MEEEKVPFYQGTGRRKTAVARVKLIPEGKGKITVNDRDVSSYFGWQAWEKEVIEPLMLTSSLEHFDVIARVQGGGISAQAGALKLGLARALAKCDEKFLPVLKKNSCLTRDSRMKERKKYGQRGSRAKFQYSKR